MGLRKPYPLFKSSEILDVISIARTWNTTPSAVLGIDEDDLYCKYCVDEAATYLHNMLQPDENGKSREPLFEDNKLRSKKHNPGLNLLMGQ